MSQNAASYSHDGKFSEEAVSRIASSVRSDLGHAASIAFVFVSPDYLEHLDEFVDILRVDGHISEVAGATGRSLLGGARELGSPSGFSILALSGRFATALVFDPESRLRQDDAESSRGVILLGDPLHFQAAEWVGRFNESNPGIPLVGGLASGGNSPESIGVFHNGTRGKSAVAVRLGGPLRMLPVVSQGCRPIGEPLPVTRVDDNMLFSLGARPAYQVLESAFESLSDSEKSTARGNLFIGLATSEYLDDFGPGDFLIRNIIGADPNSGAVLIGVSPRIGQTLQYQLRDRASADREMRRVLADLAAQTGMRPAGSLIFSCIGRGEGLFGAPGHDATLVQEILGQHPAAGFMGNGEIGPVGKITRIHGYTASCAVFFDR